MKKVHYFIIPVLLLTMVVGVRYSYAQQNENNPFVALEKILIEIKDAINNISFSHPAVQDVNIVSGGTSSGNSYKVVDVYTNEGSTNENDKLVPTEGFGYAVVSHSGSCSFGFYFSSDGVYTKSIASINASNPDTGEMTVYGEELVIQTGGTCASDTVRVYLSNK